MHHALLFPTEFLCAADLKGRDVTLTISGLLMEQLRTEGGVQGKWVVRFAEMDARPANKRKKFVLNKTNAKSIAKVWGKETNDWIGKRITIYPDTCKLGKETVDCLRIRKVAPPSKGATADVPDLGTIANEAPIAPEACDACGEIGSHVKDCPNGAGA